jgi:hypothetical protein
MWADFPEPDCPAREVAGTIRCGKRARAETTAFPNTDPAEEDKDGATAAAVLAHRAPTRKRVRCHRAKAATKPALLATAPTAKSTPSPLGLDQLAKPPVACRAARRRHGVQPPVLTLPPVEIESLSASVGATPRRPMPQRRTLPRRSGRNAAWTPASARSSLNI